MADVDRYLGLVAAEHRKPRFLAHLTALLQPLVDAQSLLASIPAAYDVDTAQGAQLDVVGVWVGISRFVPLPITGLYFAWSDATVGWGKGVWKGPYDATFKIAKLDDETYRSLVRAKIAANAWDGTMGGMQAAFSYAFPDPASQLFVQDNGDRSYSLNIAGFALPGPLMAVLTAGLIPIHPEGMTLSAINVVSVGGTPLFGWGLNTKLVGGWGVGSWPIP